MTLRLWGPGARDALRRARDNAASDQWPALDASQRGAQAPLGADWLPWEWPAVAPGDPLAEADSAADFRPELHPRTRTGEFARGAHAEEVGVTPYRGSAPATAAYFRSTRWRGFLRRLRAEARAERVEVLQAGQAWGTWRGGHEPSAHVVLRDGWDATGRVLDRVASAYDQDAVVRFRRGPGRDVRVLTRGAVPLARLRSELDSGRYPDLLGATLRPDGRAELFLLDPSAADAREAGALVRALGARARYATGRGELRQKYEDYPDSRGRRARP